MPRLLDLFCGPGGAAVGYQRAGFEVVGVDNKPQRFYPFDFHLVDALEFPLEGFDAIHASPPCQAFSRLNRVWGYDYPNLIPATRERLESLNVPWVIENVPEAPLEKPSIICGVSLGLKIIRHRAFETNWDLVVPPCTHIVRGDKLGLYVSMSYYPYCESDYREAMDCGWITNKEFRQAIPPAYTEFIGKQMLEYV